MLKMPITFTYLDLDEEEVTETESFWFNISKRELIKLQTENQGGVQGFLDYFDKIRRERDLVALFAWFEKLILLSYGVRIDGGRGFDKSQKVKDDFLASAAFNALFEELCMSEDAHTKMGKFIEGVFPPEMVKVKEILESVDGDVNKALAILEAGDKKLAEDKPST